MRIRPLFLLAALAAGSLFAAEEKMADGVYAEFATPRGTFVVELNYQQAPMTVASFVGLAEGTIAPREGRPFFTGLKWYRVVPGFVIQSGDPDHEKNADKEDAGHPYTFPDEFVPGLRHGQPGVLSMANAGPDTNSCEFFITLGDDTRLNYMHSVFGHVFTGGEVLAKIQPNDAFSIRILRVGETGRAFQADEVAFKARAAAAVKYSGEPEPGPAAHFDDPQKVLPTDVPRAKNFNYKLNNFQRATGRKLYARVYATFAPEEESQTPAAFTQKLAGTLGIYESGALAVYFADRDEWQVWVGDALMPTFNPERKRVSDLKKPLYAAVKTKAAEYTELARKTRGPDNPLKPADLAKYSVDAMLDLLIFQFEPKPKN